MSTINPNDRLIDAIKMINYINCKKQKVLDYHIGGL